MESKEGGPRTVICFLVFGILTMIYDEISLIAAQDLLAGSNIATTTVILSIAVPVLVMKLTVPWVMQRFSYLIKIMFVAFVLISGLVILVSARSIEIRLLGVSIIEVGVSTSEITFMSLTAFYDKVTVSAFVAGIGLASLLGPFYYTGLTTWIDLSPRTTMTSTVPWPLLILLLYAILDKGPTRQEEQAIDHTATIQEEKNKNIFPEESRHSSPNKEHYSSRDSYEEGVHSTGTLSVEGQDRDDGPQQTDSRKTAEACSDEKQDEANSGSSRLLSSVEFTVLEKLSVAVEIFPFIFFLFVTYFAEYLANHAVITTLAFPSSPFSPRDHYPYYLLTYHIGKFIGRSHIFWTACLCPELLPRILVKKTWVLALLTVFHLVFYVLLSWYRFIPHVSMVVVLCLTEGFTAGSMYVNSVHAVSDKLKETKRREFALGLLTVGAATGKLLAGVAGLWQEPFLRRHCLEDLNMGIYCFTRHSNNAGWDE